MSVPITDRDIASQAKKLLSPEPMLLSTLGIYLTKELGFPLRDVLGTRKLRTLLEDELGSEIRFSGETSRIEIRLTAAIQSDHPRRYNSKFWAAFSKPIKAGHARYIFPTHPFSFRDVPDDESPSADEILISSELVPSHSIEKVDRDIIVKASIAKWCIDNNLQASNFASSAIKSEKSPQKRIDQKSMTANYGSTNRKIAALLQFIDTIPEGDRNRYSLPLDLIKYVVG